MPVDGDPGYGIGTPIVPGVGAGLADETLMEELSKTILPLDTFRKMVGIDPYHFWQMSHPDHETYYCGQCYTHYRWMQSDGPARYGFIEAIVDAERIYADKLQYWPGVKYDGSEIIRITKPRQPILYNRTPLMLFAPWRHVQQVGLQTMTPLQLGATPSYCVDQDCVEFSASVSSAVSECEVVICYPDTTVEIRPARVSISGSTATITVNRWLLAKPVLWESGDCIDATDVDNLLDTVDVYRKWIDTSDQITLAWEPEIQFCGCLEEDCAVCAHATRTACATRGDYTEGAINWQIATWDEDASQYVRNSYPTNRYPDFAYVNYTHGISNGGCYMDNKWARLVSILAVALLDAEPCGCTDVMNFFRYWMEDLSKGTEARTYQVGSSDIENDIGRNRGALHAWRAIKHNIGG